MPFLGMTAVELAILWLGHGKCTLKRGVFRDDEKKLYYISRVIFRRFGSSRPSLSSNNAYVSLSLFLSVGPRQLPLPGRSHRIPSLARLLNQRSYIFAQSSSTTRTPGNKPGYAPEP